MDMRRRRSEPGLPPQANDAEGSAGDGGEGGQQMPAVQALMDGREVARVQPESEAGGELAPMEAANPFWSERAQEEVRLRQSRPSSLPAS